MITIGDMVYLIPLLITTICVFFYDYKNTKYGNKKIYLLLYIYCSIISVTVSANRYHCSA